MNLNYEKESIELPASWKAFAPIMVAGGLACVMIGALFCWFSSGGADPDSSKAFKYWTHSYLANLIFILTFALGALFFILVQFLSRAGWSTTIRRIAEILMTTIPFIAILFLPILVLLYTKSGALYEWNGPVELIHSSVVKAKLGYLERNFFTIRAVVYFGLWIWMGTWFFSLSRKQDESGETDLSLVRQKWAGPLIMLYALSVSFAAFDWVMSVDADWYSTIFGVYLFAASMMAFYALMILISMSLQRAGKVKTLINVEHYHDMGKFLFGFVMFWSYIAFSQLVLYWYGNIPEETNWFRMRINGGWAPLSYGLIALHFVIPFLGLMSRHVRRHRAGLAFWAVWAICAHWLDMTFLVMPNVGDAEPLPLIGHFFGGVGMLMIFLAFFVFRASNVPLVAVRDPRLPESLTYTNPIL